MLWTDWRTFCHLKPRNRFIAHYFILPYFNYCNQVWHQCGKRNTAKIEKVNERALRYIFNDKSASYQDLLERMRLPSLETRRIQDMLLTINNSILDKAPPTIRDLITLGSSKYNLRHDYILSLPKKLIQLNTVSNLGDILPLRNGMS